MKNSFVLTLALIVLMFFMGEVATADTHIDWDGTQWDHPVGALVGLVAAGSGLAIAAGALLLVGVILALVFAGVGVALGGAVVVAVVACGLALIPVLIPLAIPLIIVWLIVRGTRRDRRNVNPR